MKIKEEKNRDIRKKLFKGQCRYKKKLFRGQYRYTKDAYSVKIQIYKRSLFSQNISK